MTNIVRSREERRIAYELNKGGTDSDTDVCGTGRLPRRSLRSLCYDCGQCITQNPRVFLFSIFFLIVLVEVTLQTVSILALQNSNSTTTTVLQNISFEFLEKGEKRNKKYNQLMNIIKSLLKYDIHYVNTTNAYLNNTKINV